MKFKALMVLFLLISFNVCAVEYFNKMEFVGYSDAIFVGKLVEAKEEFQLSITQQLSGVVATKVILSCLTTKQKNLLGQYVGKKIIIHLDKSFTCKGYKLSDYNGNYGLINHDNVLVKAIVEALEAEDFIYERFIIPDGLSVFERDSFHESLMKLQGRSTFNQGVSEFISGGDKYINALTLELMRSYKHMTRTRFSNISTDKFQCGDTILFDVLACVLGEISDINMFPSSAEGFDGIWRYKVLRSWSLYVWNKNRKIQSK